MRSSGFLYTLISVCFPQLFNVLTLFQEKKMTLLSEKHKWIKSIYISPRDLTNICVQRYGNVAEFVFGCSTLFIENQILKLNQLS